jgi:hypothetical protein
MAKKIFLSDLDLSLNQLLRTKLENLPQDPAGSESRLYYNTAIKKIKYHNGAAWLTVIDDTDGRLTDSRTARSHVIATNTALGAEHTISGAAAGMVLRASGATSANFQQLSHSDLLPSSTGVNTHAQIDSHLADLTKHRIINDSSSLTTELFSASKILALIAGVNSAIVGALIYKDGYDAFNNTPKLDETPIPVTQGWTYVVIAAGTFYSEEVQVGDMLIAKQNNPTILAHWTVVNKNIPDIVPASESALGIIAIATATEVSTGTDDTKAITPLKLKLALGVTPSLSVATKFSVIIGNGTSKSIPVNHGITGPVQYAISRTASPFDYIETEVVAGSGTLTLNFNVAPALNEYLVVVVG